MERTDANQNFDLSRSNTTMCLLYIARYQGETHKYNQINSHHRIEGVATVLSSKQRTSILDSCLSCDLMCSLMAAGFLAISIA